MMMVDSADDDDDATATTIHMKTSDKENVSHAEPVGTGGAAAAASSSSSSSSAPSFYQMPFVEKYRPRTLDDVVGNEETVSRLRSIAVDGNLPNLILSGPPGTGKTTSIHALARQLLGTSYKDAVLELNASDARGIDVRCFLFVSFPQPIFGF